MLLLKLYKNLPYLHPVRINELNKSKIKFTRNGNQGEYIIAKGDTIIAMRKGVVITNKNKLVDCERILKLNSIEILHSDGSIMALSIPDDSYEMLSFIGETVYPGQPLAVTLAKETYLIARLMRIERDGKIYSEPFKYNCGNSQNEFTPSEIFYPEEIITLEMKKNEIKKYQKGKLF